MKNWKKLVRILLLVVIAIPTALIIGVQIPAVQTAIVGKVTDRLSEQLDGQARVGKVYLSFPNNIILKDVDLIQGEADTVAHLGKVLVNLKTSSLLFGDHARVRRISIEDGDIAIRKINDSTTNLAALFAPMRKKDRPDEPFKLPWESVSLGRLTLKHINCSTDSLDVRDINLTVRNAQYGETASARIENLSLQEMRRGFQLDRLGGDVKLDSTGLTVQGLRFDDGHTDLSGDVSLGFTDFSDFSEFGDKVLINADLRDTRFDLQTVKTLTRANVPDLALRLDGHVQGTLADLASHPLHIRSDSGNTTADLSFRIRGLPDIKNARIDAQVLKSNTTTHDLAEIIGKVSPSFDQASLRRIAPGEPLSLTAKASGTLSNLQFSGHLATASMGAATLDGTLRKTPRGMQIDGNARTETLQLGRILGNSSLGSLTCQTDVNFSTAGKAFDVGVEALKIDNFTFHGYNYHDLLASGRLKDGLLKADVVSNDPNLQLVAHADAEMGGKRKDSHYIIDLDLDYADLDALHFDKRDSSAIRLTLDADIVQKPKGAFLGRVDIRDLVASLGERDFDIGDLALLSTQEDDRYFLTLNSDVARAEYDGNVFVTDFVKQALHRVMEDNVDHLLHKETGHKHEKDSESFGSLRLVTLDLQNLLDFFAPDIYVSYRSSVGVDLIDDDVQGGFSSELFAIKDNFLRNLQGRFYTEGNRMRADIDADRFQSGSLVAENITLDALADSTFVDLRAGFHNEDGSGNRAELHSQLSFLDPTDEGYLLRADILPSEIAIADHAWELTPSTVSYKKGLIRIEDFVLQNGSQRLTADGRIGAALTDTVRVNLNDFDISLANSFLSKDLDVHGLLTGQGEAFALLGEGKGILLDLYGRQLSMAGVELGELQANSFWDEQAKRMNFRVENTLDGNHPLHATAWMRPSDKQVEADVRLDSLAMGILKPLLTGLASDIGGSVSGHVTAKGPLNKLALESEGTRFNNLAFKLDYTQVDYVADGPFTLNSKGVTFDDIRLRDKQGHEGTLNGGVPFDYFKNIRLDARINLRNMMALNTTSRDNSSFYGLAYADGSVRLSGPFDKIRLGLNLTPRANSTIHIPLGNSAKQSHSLLTFINNETTPIGLYDSLILAKQVSRQKKSGKKSDLSVNLRLNANPDAEIQVEVDKNTGDILKARGNGLINIQVTGGNFDIKGDYKVQSGSYHFGMLGITSRDFSIDPGGTIGFTGDVMQSDLDLTATYRTKASISPLIADSTAVSMRRNVECGIGVTGKLANPQIHFNIQIPDLDPTTQNRVESALNTEDKRMKQALALLISGGFVPDEQSGIVNSTTLLYSNASEMMANQLNNIFRQLDIPLDLGFNYQPTETGRDIFDVAVSTQLFNNRVSINGNIGSRQYMSSSNSDIVGDLDVEIKLNRQGQLRLTLFSHSADQYSNYLDQSQRNGAGIVYQEDFNTIGELWRKIFHLKGDDDRQTPSDPDAPRRPGTE